MCGISRCLVRHRICSEPMWPQDVFVSQTSAEELQISSSFSSGYPASGSFGVNNLPSLFKVYPFIEVWAVVGTVLNVLGTIVESAAGLGYTLFKTKSLFKTYHILSYRRRTKSWSTSRLD